MVDVKCHPHRLLGFVGGKLELIHFFGRTLAQKLIKLLVMRSDFSLFGKHFIVMILTGISLCIHRLMAKSKVS
jgi:hypothetical protein